MARHGDYLYRRNGRFYARLRVPRQLQAVYGRPDLRTSLDTTDYATARHRVLEVVLGWKRTFVRMTALLDPQRLQAGSPLLTGDGLIPLESAAREMGLSVSDVLTEARNRGLELRADALGWEGSDVPAGDLEYDDDGTLLLNSADGLPKTVIVGPLYLRKASLTLISDGKFEDCLFYRDAQRKHAVVMQLPGASVPVGTLLIDKRDAEALRSALAATVTPEMLAAAHAARSAAATTPPLPKHKYGVMRAGALLGKFFDAKKNDWGKATVMDMETMCGAFVDLMDDPILEDIDGAMMLDYRARLALLPSHIGIARRKFGVQSFKELTVVASGGEKMKPERVNEYVGKLSEFFGWAVKNGFMDRNPAAGALKRAKKVRREQDERQPITAENLAKIFSVSWFQTGRGERTAKGLHWSFQPHHYWLPLLGLYVGGRLNELSQLYLDDIKQAPSGQWYIDFNMDQPDKRDLDEADPASEEKRFKTVNAYRVVPLHSRLVQLGLLDYLAALRAAGCYQRLFPELRWNDVKGYSKQSSRWFNELFMGRKLKIKRDGSQVFHSLRHNFVTALIHADVPERVVSELAGHERGETMAGKRYAKDREVTVLAPYVERLQYYLPPIASFDVADGFVALEHALARKKPFE